MRFPCSFRSQFNEIVVPLTVWDKPHQLEKFIPFTELFRIKTNALNQEIDPFISGKLFSGIQKKFPIEMRQLNRLEGLQYPWTLIFVLRRHILQ